MLRAVELPGDQLPVPGEDRFRLCHGGIRSASVNQSRWGKWARRLRFSAARYSFCRRSS
jgi:hypothetical protein